jgi:predicted nucleotidyltransferase
MPPAALCFDDRVIATLCRNYGVAKLSLFGSALRSDFDVNRSDVDVLVTFLPGQRKSLFKLLEMQRAFSELFGRKVDSRLRPALANTFATTC